MARSKRRIFSGRSALRIRHGTESSMTRDESASVAMQDHTRYETPSYRYTTESHTRSAQALATTGRRRPGDASVCEAPPPHAGEGPQGRGSLVYRAGGRGSSVRSRSAGRHRRVLLQELADMADRL